MGHRAQTTNQIIYCSRTNEVSSHVQCTVLHSFGISQNPTVYEDYVEKFPCLQIANEHQRTLFFRFYHRGRRPNLQTKSWSLRSMSLRKDSRLVLLQTTTRISLRPTYYRYCQSSLVHRSEREKIGVPTPTNAKAYQPGDLLQLAVSPSLLALVCLKEDSSGRFTCTV